MRVQIGPFNSNPIRLDVSLRQQAQSASEQQINATVNAAGRQQIADSAKEKALNTLQSILQEKNFQVSSIYDGGFSQISVIDNDSGKEVIKLPSDAVVGIAERAMQSHLGWLIDKSI